MGRKALIAVLWISAWTVTCLKVKDNDSADSAPRLYRNAKGIYASAYASAAPYGAFSFHVPTAVPAASATKFIPVKQESIVIQNSNGFLKDSYGNKFVETPTSVAYKATFPQQFVQLQHLPAHLSQPLAATPSYHFPQGPPRAFFGAQYRLPSLDAVTSPFTRYGSIAQPFVYAGNVKSLTPASDQQFYFGTPKSAQQDSSNKKVVYAAQGYNQLQNEPKFQRLEQKPSQNEYYEEPRQQAAPSIKAKVQAPVTHTVKTTHNGQDTVVQIQTKPPLPLLDLSLLEPLTFANPIVPQVQHYLPKINPLTYSALHPHDAEDKNQKEFVIQSTKSYDSGVVKGKGHADAPKKKQKKPPKKDADVYINFESKSEKPSIKVKGTPNDPGYSYEINSPGHKETFNQQVISYNKETQSEPVTYTYEKQTQKEPVTYSYSHSSNDPGQPKVVQYVKKDPTPGTHLVYNFEPEEGGEHHDAPKSAHEESDDSNESTEADDESPPYDHAQYVTHSHQDKPSHSEHSSHSHQHHPSNRDHSHPSTHSRQHHPSNSDHSHPSTHSHQHHPSNKDHSHPSTHSHQHHPSNSDHSHPSTHSHQYHPSNSDHPHPTPHSQPHTSTHSHQYHPSNSDHPHPTPHSQTQTSTHSHQPSHPSSTHSYSSSTSHPSTPSYHSQSQHLKAEHKEQPAIAGPTPSYWVVSHKPQYYTHAALSSTPKLPTLHEYVENIRFLPSYPSPPSAAIRVDPNRQPPTQQTHYYIQQTTPRARSEGSVVSEPVIYEKSKKIIIQEESPDEVHSHQEKLTAQMETTGQNGDSEEDFEQSYKAAAYGFPAYDRDGSAEHDDEVYRHNYGEPHQEQEHSGEDSDGHSHSPFEQYTEEGDQFPKSSRLSYKDDRDKVQEDYFLGYSLNKPEIMTDGFQSKINYYKMFLKNKPEKLRVADAKKKASKLSKYTVEPSFYDSAPRQKQKQSAQYKSAAYKSAPIYEYSYDKESPRDSSAYASRPLRYKSTTHFVEPQFQYGFEPIAIPRIDIEQETMASNVSPESDKPGTRKKVYKENWYIKKTSTSSKPS